MKRILLLLVIMNSFSIVFSQSENNKETIEDYKMNAPMSIDLEEVVLISSGHTTRCRTIRCYTVVQEVEVLNKKQDSIQLYPNPSPNGFFNINLKEKYNSVQVEVSSITGQKIHSQVFQNVISKIRMCLSQYPSGIYLINIIVDGKRLPTKKAIRG